LLPSITKVTGFVRKYRLLLVLGAAALLAELAYAILNLSALPMYLKFSLHQEAALGLIISTFLLTEAVSRPAFGALGDRIGRKPLLVAGPAVTSLTAYLTIRLHGPFTVPGLVLLRAIDGLGSGALWPSAFAIIGDIVEEKNRGAALSMLNVTYMSGLALGFLMGGAANELMGTLTASFYLVSILLAMAVVVLLVFFPASAGKTHHAHLSPHGGGYEIPIIEEPAEFKLSDLVRSFRVVPDMIVLACVTFLGMGMLTPIVKLYAVEHLGMSETQVGLMIAPVAAAMGVCAVPLGHLGDRYGKCLALCWGLCASAAAMWLVALFRSIILAGFAMVIIGLGFTVAFPAWNALVISVTSAERRGEVLGAVGMAQGLAAIVGASLGAFIYSSDTLSFPRLGIVNYNVPFWLSAVLLTVGTVMSFTWIRDAHCHKDPGPGVTDRQKKAVVALAVIGLLSLAGWIGYRYTQPVAPDRVAWAWVQQLVRGRPEKAMKYVVRHYPGGWDGMRATRSAARQFHAWKTRREARYTVYFPRLESPVRADVRIVFTLTHKESRTVHVELCRLRSGEWKVCGLRESDVSGSSE